MFCHIIQSFIDIYIIDFNNIKGNVMSHCSYYVCQIMMRHPNDNPLTFLVAQYTNRETAIKVGGKMGAVGITIQIKIMDAIWSKVSVFVTDRENHKTENRYQQSLVFKTVSFAFDDVATLDPP